MHSAGLFYGDLYLVDMVISLRGNIFYSVYTSLCVLIAKMLIQHIYLYIFIYIYLPQSLFYIMSCGDPVCPLHQVIATLKCNGVFFFLPLLSAAF